MSPRIYVSATAVLAPAPGAVKLEKLGDEADPKTKRLPRVDRLAVAVARAALGSTPTDGLALMVGTNLGGLQATVDFLEGLAARGPQFGSPTAFHESVHHAPAGQISILLGITGLSLTCSARELSGETALKAGVDLLAAGRAQRVLVVCSEEIVPAMQAAYRAFGSTLEPHEGAAALLLSTEKSEVELTRLELSSRDTSTLRFVTPPRDTEQGLIQLVRAAERVRAGSASERVVTKAQGGGEATVELSRA
ncbi:MAG: beta-ketoacyl synthase chain length factor [Archangiaceae bacterium]|nr:beta-ketoacyl synthase chain length factor [Archangiaceae bacterium]